MVDVVFHLEHRNPTTGKVTKEWKIKEVGFENKGQAEAWYWDGAMKRYGLEFWARVAKTEFVEHEGEPVEQVEAPPFTAGGE